MEGFLNSRTTPMTLRGVLLAAFACAILTSVSTAQIAAPIDADAWFVITPETHGSCDSGIVHLEPPTPSAIGIHVNMPIIRGNNFGWETFEQAVAVAQAGGFYLMLNNLDGPRADSDHLAATFDNWSFNELTRFAEILANSQVPIRLYVGAIENPGDPLAVSPERLEIWVSDVFWIQSITGASAGIVVDASSMGEPDRAPGGQSRYQYFSSLARAMRPFHVEVGFEAILRSSANVPLENRRHYSLLQHIRDRYSTLPDTADHDARIMSAIDAIPVAVCPRRNTIWLENNAWDELGDGDPVPQAWLDAWGVTPDELQSEAAARLYEKGFGLILPMSMFGIE